MCGLFKNNYLHCTDRQTTAQSDGCACEGTACVTGQCQWLSTWRHAPAQCRAAVICILSGLEIKGCPRARGTLNVLRAL